MFRVPLNNDIVVLDRMIFNELGELDTKEKKATAIALINAFLNLSEETKESVAVLLTGEEFPESNDYGPKGRLFLNGRRALASTEFTPLNNNYNFITEVCIGKYPDPLFGDWVFFNVEDEIYSDHIRSKLWGLKQTDGITRGLCYGNYEFGPVGFLKARAAGIVSDEQLDRWESQKCIKKIINCSTEEHEASYEINF
jgi:hypothetical protein